MAASPECEGFTAVLCTARGCGTGDAGTVARPLVEALRSVVAGSEHGVLVSAGCLLGAAACARRPTAPVVVVQPCDADRRPVGGALGIGPLRTVADVATLGAWLRAGRLDPGLLPAHLLDVHRRVVTGS